MRTAKSYPPPLTLVEFKCLPTASQQLKDLALNLLPGARITTSDCFSQTPPVSLIITLDLLTLTTALGLPEIGWLLNNAKKVTDALQGWSGLYQLFRPGAIEHLSELRSCVQVEAGNEVDVTCCINCRIHVDSETYIVRPEVDATPDDRALLLSCLADSFKRAIKSLQRNHEPDPNITVKITNCDFAMHWKELGAERFHSASFDLNGRRIGALVDETDQVKAELRRYLESLMAKAQEAKGDTTSKAAA